MKNRNPHGKVLEDTPIVPADIIAKLSAVGGKDVAKVMLAIHALAAATGKTLDEIMSMDAIPAGAADDIRYAATEHYMPVVIHALQKLPHRHFIEELRLHKRFGARSSEAMMYRTFRTSYPALRVVGG